MNKNVVEIMSKRQNQNANMTGKYYNTENCIYKKCATKNGWMIKCLYEKSADEKMHTRKCPMKKCVMKNHHVTASPRTFEWGDRFGLGSPKICTPKILFLLRYWPLYFENLRKTIFL